jgi:hypothetical protein
MMTKNVKTKYDTTSKFFIVFTGHVKERTRMAFISAQIMPTSAHQNMSMVNECDEMGNGKLKRKERRKSRAMSQGQKRENNLVGEERKLTKCVSEATKLWHQYSVLDDSQPHEKNQY